MSDQNQENNSLIPSLRPITDWLPLTMKEVEKHGWDELGKRIPVQCFINDPSVKSSLKFLRRTPWARKKVEDLYLRLKLKHLILIRITGLEVDWMMNCQKCANLIN